MKEIQSTSELLKSLNGVLLKQRIVLFVAGFLTTLAAAIITWMLLSLVASIIVVPVWLKITLLILATSLTLYLFARFAITRLFTGDTDSVAAALEIKNPTLKGRLVAAVQFARRSHQEGFSSDLMEATEQQALARAGKIDFGRVVSFHSIRRTGRLFVGAVVLAVAVLLIAPGFFDYSFEVYSNPTTRIAPPIAYNLNAVPGSTEWVKYRDIRIGASMVGYRLPEKATIHHRLAGGNWQVAEIDLALLPRVPVESGDSVLFGVKLRQINRSFDFYVKAGDLRTEVQKIDVVDRPRVTGINLNVFYPDYTGLPPTNIDENNGSFSAVVGSRASMVIETNLPIEKAELVFSDSSRTPMQVENRSARVALTVDQSRTYRIELLDHLGEVNPDPIEYYITAIPDEYPSIDVIRPGFDVNLGDEMILPLLVRIYDDYGFSSLVMKFTSITSGRASEEHVVVLHYSDKIKTQGDVEFNWDMDRLYLFPGDYVTYYFEIADNDMISGPKISRSRKFVARVPSIDEIVAQTEMESRERIITAEDLVRSGKELSRRMKEAARKLEAQTKFNQTTDWQSQKELESIAQKNEELLQQIDKAAEEMDKSLERMQENALLSREITEKLQEIQKLFKEVATPEMLEAQKRLMEALKNMDRDELQQAMDEFQMSQEELLKRLERTVALLKKYQVEQKMEAMLRKAEQITERQAKSNENTESSDKESLSDLAKAEEENRQALEQLKEQVKELEEMLADAEMSEKKEAKEFADAVKKTDADKNMKKMSEALQQQKKKDAGSEGKEAYTKLLKMTDNMQQTLMSMQTGIDEEMAKEMRRACDHANNLSQDQETLLRDAQSLDPRSEVVRELAAQQMSLKEACSGLQETVGEMAQKTPFVSSELERLVDQAIQNMEMATEQLDDKKGARACQSQREAMVCLNRASSRLMESMQQQQQCENGGSCNKGMAQLESMCKRQDQLNKQTQGMCNKPGSCSTGKEGVGPQGQQSNEGFQRLAGEQGAIRKSMEELSAEFGDSRQILGRLSDIADEMKEVEDALASGEVGLDTPERQLKIYSRMLEATRSLQRKDFSDQRKASSASEQQVFIPPSLPQSLFDESIELEDRLRKFLDDSYPPQYIEQIKAYFRALLNAEAEMKRQPTMPPQ